MKKTVNVKFNDVTKLYEVIYSKKEVIPNHITDAMAEVLLMQKDLEYYCYDDCVAHITDKGPKQLSTVQLKGALNDCMTIREETGDDEPNYRHPKNDEVDILRNSPKVKNGLPQLRLYTKSPLFDLDWHFYGLHGFRASSGIYYDGPVIEPRQTTEHLDKVLGGFHFKSEVDRINFLGMVLTGLTMPNWIGKHGLLLINGNQPGVGKSLLAKVLGLIVERKIPAMMRFEKWESELDRQICGRLRTGQRTIILDNAKGYSASSEVLESLIRTMSSSASPRMV